MSKIQNFAEITPNLPFSEFNFYELYRATFEKSELGRMKKILPLREMAESFGLVSKPYVRPIVRGKEAKNVEFGAKCNNILGDGISFIEKLYRSIQNLLCFLVCHLVSMTGLR